jgi:hypothetical protein
MINSLYYNTVTPLLLSTLKDLMQAKQFSSFRLVGGTSLSLQRGHRLSVDIDLFTDAPYESIDFKAIDSFLKKTYKYVDTNNYNLVGMGQSYYVGSNAETCIKLDLYYTDDFIRPILIKDKLRLASIEEIIAMKIDIIAKGGRKKDFWDLHDLMNDYSLKQMLALHAERYPYSHNKALIKKNFTNFEIADGDFEPICLKQKYWEVLKLDMIDFVK